MIVRLASSISFSLFSAFPVSCLAPCLACHHACHDAKIENETEQQQQQRRCTFHVPVRVHASMGGEEYSMACACVFFSIQPPAWPAHRFQRIDCFILPVTQIFFRFVLVTFLFVAWESIDRSILRKLNGYSTNKQTNKQASS